MTAFVSIFYFFPIDFMSRTDYISGKGVIMSNVKNSSPGEENNPASLIASMDLEFLAAGIGRDTLHWSKLNAFCGYVFFRIYCLEKGRFQITDPYGTTMLEPGRLYLIPCFTPLTYTGIEPCTHFWIHFVSNRLSQFPVLARPVVLNGDPEEWKPHINYILEHRQSIATFRAAEEFRHRLSSLIVPFLDTVSNHLIEDRELIGVFSRVIAFVDENLHRDIAVSELQALSGMRRQDFSALFRKSFTIPPKQFIVLRKLCRAQRLLLETSLPIKEIARRCGWNDEYFFHKIFKKYIGSPPAFCRKWRIY